MIQVSCKGYSTNFLIDNDIHEYGDKCYSYKRTFHGKKIKSISSGACHNVILTESNQIYVWGKNDWGQLGLGSKNEQTGSNITRVESHIKK